MSPTVPTPFPLESPWRSRWLPQDTLILPVDGKIADLCVSASDGRRCQSTLSSRNHGKDAAPCSTIPCSTVLLMPMFGLSICCALRFSAGKPRLNSMCRILFYMSVDRVASITDKGAASNPVTPCSYVSLSGQVICSTPRFLAMEATLNSLF